MKVDATKIRNYIETNLVLGHKVNGNLSYYSVPFRQCKTSDIEFITDKSKMKDMFHYRLCPDFEKLQDIWML